jgi:hypothetical protein
MRTHGEPGYPNPTISKAGGHITASEAVTPGSGVDPNTPRFAAATKACNRLLPSTGVPTPGSAITISEQSDYRRAAACMRSRGITDFPDPSFTNGGVTFQSRTPIDTNTVQYERALTTCQKLIPAGLPYSGSSGP